MNGNKYCLLQSIFIFTSVFLTYFSVKAQTPDDPYPDYVEEAFLDMDFEENLLTPAVPQGLNSALSAHVRRIAEEFSKNLPRQYKKQVSVDLTRNGEVMIVTYPSEDVFNPNDTLISKYGERALQEIIPLMTNPYRFKIVYAVHSDDTGSTGYRYQLTDARMNSLYDWFLKKFDDGKIPEELVVIPETLGSDRPLTDNKTRAHRRANRRIEFYFVPGPALFEELKLVD